MGIRKEKGGTLLFYAPNRRVNSSAGIRKNRECDEKIRQYFIIVQKKFR